MSDYDITKAFEEIENELIDSMMRNFSRHRAEETKDGYNWTQWQAQRFDRRAKYSLDEDNQRFAKARADEWHNRADRLEEQNKNSVHKISDTQEQKFLTDTEIEKSDSSTEIQTEVLKIPKIMI